MINTIPDWVSGFIRYLNAKKLTDRPCEFAWLGAFEVVSPGEGSGFACYNPSFATMVVSGNHSELEGIEDYTPEQRRRFVWENIGHEYAHHVQAAEGRLVIGSDGEAECEEEARRLGDQWALDYIAAMACPEAKPYLFPGEEL